MKFIAALIFAVAALAQTRVDVARQTDLQRLSVAITAPNTLTIAGGCSVANPCSVRFGSQVLRVTASATVTLQAVPTVGGMAYIFLGNDGRFYVFDTLSLPPMLIGAMTAPSGQFPSDCIPLADWAASEGRWGTGRNLLTVFNTQNTIAPGTGIVIADAAGRLQISADTSVVAVRVQAPLKSTSTCVEGNYAADGGFFYQCVAVNTWLRTALSTW